MKVRDIVKAIKAHKGPVYAVCNGTNVVTYVKVDKVALVKAVKLAGDGEHSVYTLNDGTLCFDIA